MDEQLLRAERFLRAIALRGDRALEALELDDWQGYEQAIRWRTAAFHHFRAIDYILMQQDPNYHQSERMQLLWKDIRENDEALRIELIKQRAKLEKQLSKIRQNRATLARFHSGNKEQSGFVGTV
jgi:hypothetical protein